MALVKDPSAAIPPPNDHIDGSGHGESIEERCFSAALICLEGHFTQSPPMGPKTMAKVFSMVAKTLEKTHVLRKVRETLSHNVEIWVWLTRILAAAVPTLTAHSVGPLTGLDTPGKGVNPYGTTALIVMNYATIKEDLTILNKLMLIARNLLVNAEPQVPQDLCAAVHFDQMVYQTIILCVNVTSKGYDGEILDESHRLKLSEINELYKKLLVVSLQQTHNFISKHDRNKMSFWFDVLLDDDSIQDDVIADCSGFRPDVAKRQVQHWLDRNSRMCDTARTLLQNYAANNADKPPGNLAPIRPLAWNWLPQGLADIPPDHNADDDKTVSVWNPDETDKFEQDRAYGRVSREIDMWWLKSRDPNYQEWVIGMPSVESAQARLEHCKTHLIQRYANSLRDDNSLPPDGVDDELEDHNRCPKCHNCHHDDYESDDHDDDEDDHDHDHEHSHEYNHGCHHLDDHEHIEHGHEDEDHDCQHHHHHCHHHEYSHDYVDGILDEDDAADDESYEDGPLTGLLTEVPNILDPKQIEALHMITKLCIFPRAGSGTTRAGENLQKTRCRMFLALDCGKNLLRELLVFIAVWDKDENSLIFQVTTQIIEAIHENALIPYAWNTLRISKDIISPAQTVFLRLVNHMLSGRSVSTLTSGEGRDTQQDLRLVHFFFSSFRNRIVPECAALMHLQAQIRQGKCGPTEFPVDTWDMERAKDGLDQYLEFLKTIADIPEMRAKLVEWEAVYDLITLLTGIEAAVPKKPLVQVPKRNAGGDGMVERPYATDEADSAAAASSSAPPPHEPACMFPWAGIKSQMFMILAALLQPPLDRHSPGNPEVQMQMVRHNGIAPLLSSTVYDDHNPFAKERVTICLKWLLDGSEEASVFIRDLSRATPEPIAKPSPLTGRIGGSGSGSSDSGGTVSTLRLDGVGGDVKVHVRLSEPRVVKETRDIVGGGAGQGTAEASAGIGLEEDFMA